MQGYGKRLKDGEPAWRMLGDRAGEGYELKKWQTLSSSQQPEAGDGLRDNYLRVIIEKQTTSVDCKQFFCLIKCQSSVFLLSPPHFCSSKIFRTDCASIMATIKLWFTSVSLKLTSCETVTKETGQIGLYGA